MTTCDYGPLDATPPAQRFRFAAVPTKYGGPTEAVLIQSADGKKCLSTASAKGSTVSGFSFCANQSARRLRYALRKNARGRGRPVPVEREIFVPQRRRARRDDLERDHLADPSRR